MTNSLSRMRLEVQDMMAFRRGQSPNAEVRQEASEQMQNLADAALSVQQRLQDNGEGEIRALAAAAEQFASIDPQEATAQLQQNLSQSLQELELRKAEASEELERRQAYVCALKRRETEAKTQIVVLNEKLKKTPATHSAVPVISGIGDRGCTHLINPQIGKITDAPPSRISTGTVQSSSLCRAPSVLHP